MAKEDHVLVRGIFKKIICNYCAELGLDPMSLYRCLVLAYLTLTDTNGTTCILPGTRN